MKTLTFSLPELQILHHGISIYHEALCRMREDFKSFSIAEDAQKSVYSPLTLADFVKRCDRAMKGTEPPWIIPGTSRLRVHVIPESEFPKVWKD